MTDTIKFHNNTALPIIVSTWIEKMPGLSEYIDITILSGETIDLYSDVGEWIIGSLFSVKEYNDQWTKEKLPHNGRLAKFRNNSCFSGNFTWNFTERHFTLEYKDGLVTWSRISI